MPSQADGFESIVRVLGIDLASSNWDSNGSALLAFRPDAARFAEVRTPALKWPSIRLSAVAIADTIDSFARHLGVTAIALDGPQGWRDPETPMGTPGVGRRCEFECRTQAKTGAYPQTYPSNQVRWVEFCVEVFASLLARRGVHLAGAVESTDAQRDYVILECFPTSIWRSAGLTPLPAKSRTPDLGSFGDGLFAAFGLPGRLQPAASHDDLQALVGALAAAAYVGGPAVPMQHGVEPVVRQVAGRSTLTEGYIWNARPLAPIEFASPALDLLDGHPVEPAISAVRVTQKVIDQVARAGRSQAQIVLRGFPQGSC